MHNLCRLWAFGNQLVAPRFTNVVMYAFFSYFYVVEIYKTTSPGSKLRKFCADLITAKRAFSGEFSRPLESKKWRTLIKKGDVRVLDQVETGSIKDVSHNNPYYYCSHAKYIDKLEKVELKGWLKGKE